MISWWTTIELWTCAFAHARVCVYTFWMFLSSPYRFQFVSFHSVFCSQFISSIRFFLTLILEHHHKRSCYKPILFQWIGHSANGIAHKQRPAQNERHTAHLIKSAKWAIHKTKRWSSGNRFCVTFLFTGSSLSISCSIVCIFIQCKNVCSFVCVCVCYSLLIAIIVLNGIWKALKRSASESSYFAAIFFIFIRASSFDSWLYKTQTSDASGGVSELSDCVYWRTLTADCWIRVSIIHIGNPVKVVSIVILRHRRRRRRRNISIDSKFTVKKTVRLL